MGRKNVSMQQATIAISQLDWHNLMSVTPDGLQLPIIFIEGVELERLSLIQGETNYLLPGMKLST